MDLLEVGKIVNTHGLRGEVKVVSWTDTPDVFEDLEYVYCGEQKLTVQNVKYQKNNLIVKFKEIPSIDDAEKYKNKVLTAERSMLGELPDGVYYIADLIGLDVYDDEGNHVGVLADVFNTGSNDIYEVKRDGKKPLLLPVIDEVVLDISLDDKKITVHIMEGLDEL